MEVMVVAIFSELRSESGVMSVSTFKEYLNRHGIQCTIIELWYLLSPYAQSPQFVSSSKFTSFANSLKKLDEHRIISAFPETFGVSTRIERTDRGVGPSGLGNPRIRRNYAVSANLYQLSAYYDRISMN